MISSAKVHIIAHNCLNIKRLNVHVIVGQSIQLGVFVMRSNFLLQTIAEVGLAYSIWFTVHNCS